VSEAEKKANAVYLVVLVVAGLAILFVVRANLLA
jgi:hypothetical protein